MSATTPPQKQQQKNARAEIVGVIDRRASTLLAAVEAAAPVPRTKQKESAMVLDISRLLFARHLRAEPTAHVLFFKDGALTKSGPGLAFWFLPLGASVSAVPLDDRELPILIKGRTADFQESPSTAASSGA